MNIKSTSEITKAVSAQTKNLSIKSHILRPSRFFFICTLHAGGQEKKDKGRRTGMQVQPSILASDPPCSKLNMFRLL